ncbi:hypothetical protein Tco_1343631 [Tanacetum coccineum]
MRQGLRKTTYPVTDLQEMGQAAQSLSQIQYPSILDIELVMKLLFDVFEKRLVLQVTCIDFVLVECLRRGISGGEGLETEYVEGVDVDVEDSVTTLNSVVSEPQDLVTGKSSLSVVLQQKSSTKRTLVERRIESVAERTSTFGQELVTPEVLAEDNMYSTVDACPTAREMWLAIKCLQQGESLNKQDVKTKLFGNLASSLLGTGNQLMMKIGNQRDKQMQKSLALIAKHFKNIYRSTTNNLRNSSNTMNKNVDTCPRIEIERQTGFGHFAKECRKPKRLKDYEYDKEKMMLCKQESKEVEAHYMYMAKIQEVLHAADDNSGPTYNAEPLEKEELKEEFEEDPEEDPEEELEAEAEEDAPPAATPPVGSPITPPPLSEYSSDTEAAAPIIASEALEMPPTGSTFKVGGPSSVSLFLLFYLHGHEILRLNDNTEILFSNVKYLERYEKKRRAEMDANSSKIHKVKRRMDDFDRDLGHEVLFTGGVEGRVTKLEDKDQEKTNEMEKMKKRLKTLETNYASVLCDRDGWKEAFYNLQAWVSERFGRGAMDARQDDGVDGSATFRESQPPKPLGSPSSSQ